MVAVTQIVSRHDPFFSVKHARLSIGVNGRVYLASPADGRGRVLHCLPDGTDLRAGLVGYSVNAIAANGAATVATAEIHIPHRVAFWDQQFGELGAVTDFLPSDQYSAPSDVQAVPGADHFYAIDQHRHQVRRVSAPDILHQAYPLDLPGAPTTGPAGLRVSEADERFVTAWWPKGIWSSSFDGDPAKRSSIDDKFPAADQDGLYIGGFDLDDAGNLYVVPANTDLVEVFDPALEHVETFPLAPAQVDPPPIRHLRVLGDELFVKRADPATLFEVYSRLNGQLVRRKAADVEVLTVSFGSKGPDTQPPVWTAGEPVPFYTAFDPGPRATNPKFRAWLRPLGVPEFTEHDVTSDSITPALDARGLYQLRVSPDVRGRSAEYVVDRVVEVRAPSSAGSVSILTRLNRFYFGCGESIPVTVLVRAPNGTELPPPLTVSLHGETGVALTSTVAVRDGKGEFTISSAQTGQLAVGRYRLDADVPGFTVAPQHLELGPGIATRPDFHITQHGDFVDGFPRDRGVFELPEATADHLARCRALGLNLFVDRLGDPVTLLRYPMVELEGEPGISSQLAGDPAAVAAQKAMFEDPARRTIAAYGAWGIEEQAILLYMDANIPPLTPSFDARAPDVLQADVKAVGLDLLDYPAFRGWSWAANWWAWERIGAGAAKDDAERAEYEAALAVAHQTGAWAGVLDTVAGRAFAYRVEAEKMLRAALQGGTPGALSVMTGPYRTPQAHPPVVFAGADEVDLHYQSEQIQPPQVTPHNVDYYKRPGKPAWAHPELWNDDGTGGMLLPALCQIAMRGAEGIGKSGPHGDQFVAWDNSGADPRSGIAGTTSVLRAAYGLLGGYASVLASAEKADRVAIVVSTRMAGIETWDGGKIGGPYFDALFEAYNACLYAHRPASFVFTEDLGPDTLADFSAILVVAQTVELEPPLAQAIESAAAAGVKVFCDGGCRDGLVASSIPLGTTFDRVSDDPSAVQGDGAYQRFRRYFIEHSTTLRAGAFGQAVAPVAECDNPEVMLTERAGGDRRFIWVVNNTMLDWEPGQAWRVSLLLSHRIPVIAKLKLTIPSGHKVVDVITGKDVPHSQGQYRVDLRTMPARLLCVAPATAQVPQPDTAAGPHGGERRFGPHVRDVAISSSGKMALLTCFNWDHNLYGLSLKNGVVRRREKIGNFFAFSPKRAGSGFAVQGFDLASPEGYHLYRLDGSGDPERRFALFGLPKRATSWAVAGHPQDRGITGFATAPDGSWVATAGDLGLAVWNQDGSERWTDEWWPKERRRLRLLALDDSTLITLERMTVRARDAMTDAALWELELAKDGTLLGGVASADQKTLVVWSDTLSGRTFVIRGGQVVNTIAAPVGEADVAPDGSWIALTTDRQLRAYDALAGLVWSYTGDDTLRRPRISTDGSRVAVGSELGTLSVLTRDGAVLAEKDLASLPVPAWFADGDLLAATWMGQVVRFNPALEPKWSKSIVPAEKDAGSKLLAQDTFPTTRKSGWGNADPRPRPLTPNLLADTKAVITASYYPEGLELPWTGDIGALRDGNPDPPTQPWVGWYDIGRIDSGWQGKFAITVDTFRTQLRLTGVTFVEDPAHPESWLRDLRLQCWDPDQARWNDAALLLSNESWHSHTHTLPSPIEGSRFRFVTTGGGSWPAGNVRLGQLVFHGDKLGPSHPDILAGHAVAVLFDEREADLSVLVRPGGPARYCYTDAYSGGKSLELPAAALVAPGHLPDFGHAVPNWDFAIEPGQYRYLHFAWKARSAATTGLGLLLGTETSPSGVAVTVGTATPTMLTDTPVFVDDHQAGAPPTAWTTHRVDLWAATGGSPAKIRGIRFVAVGDGGFFDQILLGRTEEDLDAWAP